MRKINWKIFNIALWIEFVAAYLLPFKVVDNFQYKVGFPIPFLSVYDTAIGITPLTSMHLNPIALLADAIVICIIISFCINAYQKAKPTPTQ